MHSQWLPIVLNLFAAFLGAVGQYSYKLGAQKLSQGVVIQNVPLFVGILLFCLVMACFVAAYQSGGRISIVYPFYATTFFWGTLIAAIIEKEPLSMPIYVGTGFIFLGLVILSQGATQ